MSQRQIPVQLETVQGGKAKGEVTLEEWGPSERTKRSLKALGLTWLAAVISVFVPIIHFFSVPGLLLAGPVVAWITYQRERRIAGGRGTCPACQAAFAIVKGPVRWPMSDLCASCQTPVSIAPCEAARRD